MTKSKITEKAFQKPGFVGNFRLPGQDKSPRSKRGTATYSHREAVSGNRQSKDFCGFFPSMRPLSAGSCGLPTISHDGAVISYYGADGITEGIPNCSMSSGMAPEVRSVRSTLRGSSSFNLAVRMTVVIRDTFFLPCLDLVPKVSLLKMTEFLKPRSARLFVGSIISGYLRNVKIPVCGIEVGDENARIELSEMSPHDCGGAMFVNVEKGDVLSKPTMVPGTTVSPER